MSTGFDLFCSTQKNNIKKHLKSIGCTNIKFGINDGYFFGFFTSPTGKKYYLCTMNFRSNDKIFHYREVESYQEYLDGENKWIAFDRLGDMTIN
jgi:hypothetical protein